MWRQSKCKIQLVTHVWPIYSKYIVEKYKRFTLIAGDNWKWSSNHSIICYRLFVYMLVFVLKLCVFVWADNITNNEDWILFNDNVISITILSILFTAWHMAFSFSFGRLCNWSRGRFFVARNQYWTGWEIKNGIFFLWTNCVPGK